MPGPKVNAFSHSVARLGREIQRHRAVLACFCVLALMGMNLFSQAACKSLTNDEIVHIPAGYLYLSERDFGVNNEHPPLVKIWAALPLAFMNLNQPPPEHDSAQNSESRTIPAAMAFWQANRSKFESIVFWSRVPMIILTVGLGALIFIYARKTF